MIKSLSPHVARLSLATLLLTLVATGVHHIFRLGPELILPMLIALTLATALWILYQRTEQRVFLLAYAVFTALIVFWFGFLDGFLDHVVKAAGLDNITFLPGSDEEIVATVYQLWSQETTSAFYEGTGVLSAFFALLTLVFTTAYLTEKLAPKAIRPAT